MLNRPPTKITLEIGDEAELVGLYQRVQKGGRQQGPRHGMSGIISGDSGSLLSARISERHRRIGLTDMKEEEIFIFNDPE